MTALAIAIIILGVNRRKAVAGGWAAKTRVRLAYNDVGTTLGFGTDGKNGDQHCGDFSVCSAGRHLLLAAV